MTALAALPGLLAIVWLIRKGRHAAYLDVYLTSLLLLPGWCRWPVPGAPDPTFNEAAMLPVAAAFLWQGSKHLRFSVFDLLVVSYGLFIGYSEYQNAGYKEAQNLMFDMVAAAILPYFCARAMAETKVLQVAFIRRFVWQMAVLACILLYEFKFAYNPYRMVFDHFFPGQGDGWVTTFRYGLPRVAGPFGHAILAGVVFMIAFRLARWLQHAKHWEPDFKWFRSRFSKAQMITAATLAGVAMTLVRGPQIGTLIAVAVAAMGKGRNPKKRARFVLAAILLVGIPAGIAMWSYASVGRAAAQNASQESAAYRKELIDKYVDIALQHAPLGWGRNGWPKIPGMPSIDNFFLLLSLMHGVPAVAMLVLILVSLQYRLLRNGFRSAPMRPEGSSLSFTMAGIFVGFSFSILTVYMGDSLIPIFFTMAGFCEGYLQMGGDAAAREGEAVAERLPVPPRFAHVIA